MNDLYDYDKNFELIPPLCKIITNILCLKDYGLAKSIFLDGNIYSENIDKVISLCDDDPYRCDAGIIKLICSLLLKMTYIDRYVLYKMIEDNCVHFDKSYVDTYKKENFKWMGGTK